MPRNPAQSTNKSKYFQWERVNANLLLSKFAEARKIQDGRCAFDAGDYHFWLPVLNSALRPTTPEAMRLRDGCIKISLSDPAISLKDTEAFLARCDQQFEVFSKRSKSRFILYSTITYSGPRLVQWIGEGASRIYWGPGRNGSLLRKIRASQKPFSFQKSSLGLPPDDDLTPILVHVSAFDAWDAFEQSNDCIDRFRGLLNLLINSSKSINIFARLSEPHAMNRFRRGPLHTLHKPGGALATETFWYEHRWLHKAPTIQFADPGDYRRSVQRWWAKVQKSQMREFISDMLLRYCRALDLHEADASLLGMWQVLEKLTGTDKYDQLVERIARLFKDPDDARELAKHLRIRRNQTVHSSTSISKEADVILLQVETLASRAIFFLIEHAGRFKNLDEYYAFLDLPLSDKQLKREREITEFYINYKNRPAV